MADHEVWASASSNQPRVDPEFLSSQSQGVQACPDCPYVAPATCRCPACEEVFCDKCWITQRLHAKGKAGHDRMPLVEPEELSDETRLEQHLLDYSTLWFAIPVSETGDLSFELHPRFGDLMREHIEKHPRRGPFYPHLVSFVGGTGAGKSYIIRELIKEPWVHTDPHDNRSVAPRSFPVVGDRSSSIPTSSDVHLYHSPNSDTEAPLLFADCEGFEGGGRPAAFNAVANFKKDVQAEQQPNPRTVSWMEEFGHSALRAVLKPLSWCKSGDGSQMKREDALKELLPRLIYNTSGVIVYVLSESENKKIGHVLQQLVEWSQKTGKTAVNQAALPSLIVVLNQCDPWGEWDAEKVTARILEENKDIASDNRSLLKRLGLADNSSMESILNCSYMSVKFIRLPRVNHENLLAKQLSALQKMIGNSATQFRNFQRESNMLLRSEHLNQFYKLVFDHFSKYRDEPFDFMEAFFSMYPVPVDLESILFNLLRSARDALITAQLPENSESLANALIENVFPVLASAIAAKIYDRIPGTLSNVIQGSMSEHDRTETARDSSYERKIQAAVDRFLETSCKCHFSQNGKKCENSKLAHRGHRKHQDSQGKRFGGVEGFQADPFYKTFMQNWRHVFLEAVKCTELADTFRSSRPLHGQQSAPELPEPWRIHLERVRKTYQSIPDFNFPDTAGCFWCLHDKPTQRLPCGHWICESCLVQVGTRSPHDDRLYLVLRCDRHKENEKIDFIEPFEFLRLPTSVGRRLLSLDEGGVRCVADLYLLKALQDKLGPDIPLQDCFDLIGATGAGGVVALGLTFGRWSIPDAIEKLKAFVKTAFSERASWWVFQWFWKTYRPERLDAGIREAFGEDWEMTSFMSTQEGSSAAPPRVAVVVESIGRGCQVLTSYCRRQDIGQMRHGFPICPYSCEWTVQKAARATATHRDYFEESQEHAGDKYRGAEYDNSALATVNEAESLWPDALKKETDPGLPENQEGASGDERRPEEHTAVSKGHPDVLISVGSTEQWPGELGQDPQKNPMRYIRICPNFGGSLPNADDKGALESGRLKEAADSFLWDDAAPNQNERRTGGKVDLSVHRLIATMFYFDSKKSPSSNEEGEMIISGNIRCRFKDTSNITKAFGTKMKSLEGPSFTLALESAAETLWIFEKSSITSMESQGTFSAPIGFRIPQSSEIVDIKFTTRTFSESISGFPVSLRSLLELH